MGQAIKRMSQVIEYNRPEQDLLITGYGEDEYENVLNCKRKFFVEIFAENYQCMGIDKKENIYTWGLNNFGQLGNGTVDDYFKKNAKDKKYIDTFSLINPINSLLHKKKIIKFSAGHNFSSTLGNDGVLYTWGTGNEGQLGYDLIFKESHIVNSNEKCQLTPRIVEFFVEIKAFIIDMACGKDFMITLDNQGKVYSFGNNEFSQLGREFTVNNEANPKIIELPEKIEKVCCGWRHGMILSKEGNVFIWGNPFREYEEKFENIKNPIQIEHLGKVSKIASGFHHFVVLTKMVNNQDEMITWGGNDYGQLGYVTSEEFSQKPHKLDLSKFEANPINV